MIDRPYFIAFLLGFITILGCSENKKENREQALWKFNKEILIDGISPIGIVTQGDFLWLSDVDNNRVVKIDLDGKVLEEYSGFQRPMHIAIQDSKIYIPEFTSDILSVLENGVITTYPLKEIPDAIGGVAIEGNKVAFADFYNHRIILQQGETITIIGKEGHNDGELYYPTDVAFKDNLIYVADAYNNRVQVFAMEGKYVKMIGWNDGIKVATGIKVTETQVIVVDFEGNRVMIYDKNGELLQTLDDNFDQPTDIEVIDNKMYILNYSTSVISFYEYDEIKE
jgi:DNA-binding beta-propeller fold protein YncE